MPSMIDPSKFLKRGLNIILDTQWGSTGKGKLCGFLGSSPVVHTVASSFGPNAGHTYIDPTGKKIVYSCLPSSAYSAPVGSNVLIMPDSVINVAQFLREVETLENQDKRVYVHPLTAVVTEEDENNAKKTGKHIAGTMKGTGHALSRKMLRIEGVKLAGHVLPEKFVHNTCDMMRDAIARPGCVIFEMSQGFDLSLNHGWSYPFCTSRDITIGTAINSCGVSHRDVAQVIGCMRTYPIRVGNVEGGWSGPCHSDQSELSWEQVTNSCRSDVPIIEMTTVTGRVRRVFTFSMIQLQAFVRMNRPDWMFLNFIQYLDHRMNHASNVADITECGVGFISSVEAATGVDIPLVGTGAGYEHLVEINPV